MLELNGIEAQGNDLISSRPENVESRTTPVLLGWTSITPWFAITSAKAISPRVAMSHRHLGLHWP